MRPLAPAPLRARRAAANQAGGGTRARQMPSGTERQQILARSVRSYSPEAAPGGKRFSGRAPRVEGTVCAASSRPPARVGTGCRLPKSRQQEIREFTCVAELPTTLADLEPAPTRHTGSHSRPPAGARPAATGARSEAPPTRPRRRRTSWRSSQRGRRAQRQLQPLSEQTRESGAHVAAPVTLWYGKCDEPIGARAPSDPSITLEKVFGRVADPSGRLWLHLRPGRALRRRSERRP